jgi:hypothetical protein
MDLFNTQLVTTLNYSTIANFHTLEFTTAHAMSFSACSVFTSSCLVMTSNDGYSSASVFKSSLNGGSLPTLNSNSSYPPYNPSAWTTVENTFSNSTSIVARSFVAVETCLFVTVTQQRLWYIFLSRGRCLLTTLHSTIYFIRNPYTSSFLYIQGFLIAFLATDYKPAKITSNSISVELSVDHSVGILEVLFRSAIKLFRY